MVRLSKKLLSSALFAILAIAVFPGISRAQGSRKDDIVFNAQGRPMAGAAVRICSSGATGQPCSPLANIYSDAALTQALANPLSADGLGNYTFYAAPGRYEIEISGPGITTKQLPNVILPSDPSTPTFTSVTTTSGISAFSLSLAGNLTVSGSAAVTGSLTVGGAPVPSTNADNQWAANQRFGGPIPWRDFTKYMPPGGCSTTNTNDPPATGTISSGSHSLALSTAASYKTGCGVNVIGAGPTATIAMASTSTGTTTRVGTLVTLTITSGDPHLAPGIGSGSGFAGPITVTGCSDSNFNTTTTGWLLNFGTPVTSLTYNTSGSGGTTATGCTANFLVGWAHGTTGSTTWDYKIAPIDASGGVGAAVGPITITNGNATLSPYNYNWVGWQVTPGAREFAVYRDVAGNGVYSCINIAYYAGYSDWGGSLHNGCPAYVPSTPPASPTAESLDTTITAGGGTTTLTLSAAASNNVTTQPVYEDVSMFLADAINDVQTDQINGGKTAGSYGVYIPYGLWPFNADMPTDTISGYSSGGVAIHVAGTPLFQSWPWMIGANYSIIGQGYSGGNSSQQYFPTTLVSRGPRMPSGLIIRGSGIDVENLQLSNMLGHGIVLTQDPSSNASTAGINMNNIHVDVQGAAGIGVPLMIDGNTIFANFDNMNLIPNSTCNTTFPASILFTETKYSGNGHADIVFHNLATLYHHIVIDSPGGQNNGQGTSFAQTGLWWSEDHGTCPTGGTITVDTGVTNGAVGAPSSSARLAGALIENMQNADSSNKYLVSVLGNQTLQASIFLRNSDQFNTQTNCLNGSTTCGSGNDSYSITTDSGQLPSNTAHPFIGPIYSQSYLINYPTLFGESYGQSGPFWANIITAPNSLTVTGTGSGSLSAGTYCFVVEAMDSQGTPGHSLPSSEICQTVGASSSISLRWSILVEDAPNFRIYYGPSPGSESNYFTQAVQASLNQTYTFSTTSGSSAGTPDFNVSPTAYSSWLNDSVNGISCLLCVKSGFGQQLGIGEPSPPSGDEMAVKGGVLDAENGFKSALTTKSSAYTLTTSDYWVNVTGTTTITVPHASTGNHWVVFNSGSNTVTIQADSGNINGASNITISANTGKEIACDGTNCFAH